MVRVEDERVFGWDAMPGIVSVWANREGRAVVWQRLEGRIAFTTERFRPWLFATTLEDLAHLGKSLLPWDAAGGDVAAVSYRELEGPEGSYRYLLSARDGRALERMLLNGASRRLGRQVSNLNDLPETYYRVGPVEQYLMLTGRVYFRGMVYDDLHRLQFDLETTALDPHRGRIFMVSMCDNRGLAMTIDAPSPDEEAELITRLCALIRERDPDVIENHNLFGFDLPFLEQRAEVLGIPLILGRMGGPTLLERREETLAIGPDARRRTRYSLAGRRYALGDVAEVDGLSRRLLGAPFALAGMAPRRYERLASAGPAMGILEPMLVRAYLRAGAALPGQATNESAENGLHEGGAVHLFAEGIAEQVVKTDVASLYPSLMRTYQIGPACDHLGVLLSILSRLTDLRLAHKAAARKAAAGSIEANMHDATQAAMKILINAAYGYMGAGSMALFADSRAAGEVTQRGREVLNQVVGALRKRGMALIEGDTDGVYFAVPGGWSEEQERALVDEVAAELPEGIRLEYEGRFKAMFSHEVKNYALLTYGEQLIVRGVALRSSRAEPFGERFLRKALLCVMTNDIVGLRRTYLETVQALRNRALPASELGAKVRLSKTPEAYMASRAGHPEAQYEALLSAGRTRWFPGERVRYYRARNKRYVWLPEETDEASIGNNWEAEAGANGEEREVAAMAGGVASEVIQDEPGASSPREDMGNRRDYDVDHYIQVLVTSYAARLRKAFSAEDFEQLFRLDGQEGLFDRPVEDIEPRWIRCS
ncbi:MAG: DNA polymerase [Chloroflexi bacterium]|nr:MAG: DNA polymerase [Chloroflexota bacterium]